MGFGCPAGKKGHFFPLAPEEEPAIPHMGRPTDKASSAFRHPRGGGLNMEVGTTPPPDQVGGWVSDQPQKNRPLIGQMVFCPPLGKSQIFLGAAKNPSKANVFCEHPQGCSDFITPSQASSPARGIFETRTSWDPSCWLLKAAPHGGSSEFKMAIAHCLKKRSSLVNTLPITKKNKHTVVIEAPKKYMCSFCASKFAPEGLFRLQLASF